MIKELVEKGTIVVAACSNSNVLTYPASMSGVIGVRCDKTRCLKSEEFLINDRDIKGIQITVGSLDAIYKEVGNSNSFVTPYITAIISNLINSECKNCSDVINWLRRNSKDKSCIDFEYEKSTLNVWANYEPFIICVKNTNKYKDLIVKFQRFLIDKGYNTIIITDAMEGMCPFVYNINDYQYLGGAENNWLEYLIMNITRPDIILTTSFNETDQGWINPDCCFTLTEDASEYPLVSQDGEVSDVDKISMGNEVIIKDIGKFEATIFFEGREETINYQTSDDVIKNTISMNIGVDQLLQEKTIEWLENNF